MKKKLLLALSFMGAAMLSQAQGKIGGTATAPNPNAFLQLGDAGANKGLLMPRVALSATNLPGPLSAHVEGMYVYNTVNAGTGTTAVTPGLYYNDGTKWARVVSGQTSILGSGNPTSTPPPGGPYSKGTIYSDTLTYMNNDWTAQTPNTDFGQQWTYDGTKWISYSAPASTAWYLAGGTTDAGGNKANNIYRSGNVGIGTKNPGSLLTIRDNTTTGSGFSASAFSGIAGLAFNREISTGAIFNSNLPAYQMNATSAGLNFMVFKGDGSNVTTNALTIDPTAKVGIGTAATGSNLTIRDNTTIGSGVSVYTAGNASYLAFNREAATGTIFNSSLPAYQMNATSAGFQIGVFNGSGVGVQASALSIKTNGSVGIGSNLLPDGNNTQLLGSVSNMWSDLYVTNCRTVNVYSASGLVQQSDIRLKKNITPLEYGLKDILKIDPISYNWIDEKTGTGRVLGVSAQQVQTILPEAVNVGSDAQHTLGVNYAEITPVLINAVKEQQTQIETLKKSIEDQQAQIDALKQAVAQLQAAK